MTAIGSGPALSSRQPGDGLLIEETDLPGGMRLTHWKQSVPIATWLTVLGVARFAVQHWGDYQGRPLQTWVYAQDRDAGFYDFSYPTREVLEFFGSRIGPYSYEKLANVQSHSVRRGAMESATAIFYEEDSVTGERTIRWRNVITHEIAHQWFGNSVTEYDWDDVWLSEGFATYFTLLFIEEAFGRAEFVAGLKRSQGLVQKFYQEHPDARIVHDNLSDMSKVINPGTYQKGAWTLHMLRGVIGTEAFWDGIRSYYREHRNGNATTDDLRRAMEAASGQELGWLFQQWLYRPGPVAGGRTLALRRGGRRGGDCPEAGPGRWQPVPDADRDRPPPGRRDRASHRADRTRRPRKTVSGCGWSRAHES